VTAHSETVHSERHGGIGVIIVDNPPVNAIAPSVREGIAAAVRELDLSPAVRAVVLHCAGSTFMAGADIRALAAAPGAVTTAQVVGALESMAKPAVAALQGNALGGGLEIAIGCHYRCADPRTRLGLPEVNLGLIPGAGGTQRLPRLVGIEAALRIIGSGTPVTAAEALRIGLVDRVIDSRDLLAAALAWARELLDAGAPLRRMSELAVPPVPDLDDLLEAVEAGLRRSRRGEIAPLRAIEAVRAAATSSFQDGMAVEARLFAECRDSSQSRALRHLFLAERQAAKVSDLPDDTATRAIRRVGVLGGGTMGRGIALAFCNAGLPVELVETDATALERAMAAIADVHASAVSKGRITAAQQAERLARVRGGTALDAFADVDLVVEAVFEDLPLKRRVFADLERTCPPHAILASNTSALDIDAIADATPRPQDVIGLHFFSPAHIMRLVEVVRGRRTGKDVVATAMKLVRSLDKIGVVAGNCDGFIGNRMLVGYRREAEFLLLEGASPQQVDRALVGFGMSMGPHAMSDLAGLDVGAAGRRRRRAEGRLPDDARFGVIGDRLVELGRLGQKTAAGFYRYESGSRDALPDPTVTAIIEQESGRLGITRREIGDEEIVDRCIYPLINEAARILDEGIAQRPGDVDVVWVNGYGFPRTRGGPMQFADETGPAQVFDRLRQLSKEHGPLYWTPAPLIERLAGEGRTFASLN
jgi:3-hydroxyacyl-CoA dehydrogenase